MALHDELNQRGVIRAAAMYVAIAWGGTEILVFLVDAIWSGQLAVPVRKYIAILFVAGFPVAMYLAWTRDLGHGARRFVSATAIAIVLVAVLVWVSPTDQREPTVERVASSIRSLAVLPLDNLSGDPAQDYFAAGMTEALIANLSRFGGFKVISRTSVMRYKGTTLALPEIARELGVDAIVEGSVLRSGDRVQITVQLIDAATDHHIWADTFEGETEDVLAVQSAAAEAMVQGIGVNMAGAVPRVSPARRVIPEAYDAYLKAQLMGLQVTTASEDVIKMAEKAIELDPTFAPAYSFLSDLYGYLALTTNMTGGEAYIQARQLAVKALDLDPSLPIAHAAMARIHFQFEWDWNGAEDEFQRALALNQNDPVTLALYGDYRVLVHADCDGGLDLLMAARSLSPFEVGIHFDLGVYSFHCGRYEESIRHLARANEIAPDFLRPRMITALNYAMMGEKAKAADQCDLVLEEIGDHFDAMAISSCAWTNAVIGNRQKAVELSDRLRDPPEGERVDSVVLGWNYMVLGDNESGIQHFEEAMRRRSSNLIFFRVFPKFGEIRDDPRFVAIMEKMAFPDWEP
jgi:TolB-like protein/tetratricopeptide (TPR) repeat protein